MRIGTTPTYTFKLPFSVDVIQKAKVTFRQGNSLILEKIDGLVLEDNSIKVSLTQEDTFKFDHQSKVDVQLRIVTLGNDALASNIYSLGVEECLDKEVL